MNSDKFTSIVEDGIEWSRNTLCNKAKVYQNGDDRLSNFKAAGRMDAVTPERALWSMALKHRVKLEDIVTAIGDGELPTNEQLRETTGDLRNYLHLLEALIIERIDNEDAHLVGGNKSVSNPKHRYIKYRVDPYQGKAKVISTCSECWFHQTMYQEDTQKRCNRIGEIVSDEKTILELCPLPVFTGKDGELPEGYVAEFVTNNAVSIY